MAIPEEASERELAREAAQLRIAATDERVPAVARESAERERQRILRETDWSSASHVLAADLGRPPEAFEGDYEIPDFDDLELVGGGSA